MIRKEIWLAAALLAVAMPLIHVQPAEANGGHLQVADQSTSVRDPRWSPWLGCWTPGSRPGPNTGAQLCIVPGDGVGVRMITFDGDTELLAETVVADGTTQSMSDKDCSGDRTSRWARSGLRLFFASSLKCADQPDVKTTGMSSLVTADQWIDVQVAIVRGREQVRVRRFWRSSDAPPAPVAGLVASLAPAQPAVSPIDADDVIEASRAVASNGVEAWLAESGSRVVVDRQALVRLSHADVPEAVIDLMVALAYPKKFEVRRVRAVGGSGLWSGVMLQPFGASEDLTDFYGLGFGSIGMWQFFDTTWYYDPGWSYEIPGAPGGPVEEQPHGHVVNGQGYTQVQPREPYRAAGARQAGSGQGAESSGSDGGSSGSSSGSSGSSGASPSGYSGGGGTSTGLTAVPR